MLAVVVAAAARTDSVVVLGSLEMERVPSISWEQTAMLV